MISPGMLAELEGAKVDSPNNALTLTMSLHQDFGAMKLALEAVPSKPHVYKMVWYTKWPGPYGGERHLPSPPDPDLPAPSCRCLALHAAYARIMHLSGAVEYFENLVTEWAESPASAAMALPILVLSSPWPSCSGEAGPKLRRTVG